MEFESDKVYKKLGFSRQEQLEDMETHSVSTEIRRSKTLVSFAFNEEADEEPATIEVKEWKGMFFLENSWDHDPEGPFKSLSEALGKHYFTTRVANPEITSARVSARVLRKIGRQVVFDDGSVVKINGQELVLKKGRLVARRAKGARGSEDKCNP